MSPAPRPSSHLKPLLGPHPATLPSSPQPLRTSGPQNSTSASLPQVNGGFRAPAHQLLGASKLPQSLCKERKRSRPGELQGPGPGAGEAVAPPGKRRRKRRKHLEDAGTLQEGPERRKAGWAELLAARLEDDEGGRHLANGWHVGCRPDSPHASSKKRKGRAEGLGGEGGLSEDPPGHSGCCPSDALEPEATAASPRRKKRKKKPEPCQEVAGTELAEGWRGDTRRGATIPGDGPSPAANVLRPGDRAGLAQAPWAPWDREQEGDVVRELLKYCSDTAYGKRVLTWDGAVSAVSQDAVRDSRAARTASAIDDWDQEVDRGKEKKIKKFKREKKRNFNAFQKLQSRRNFWSVTHPAKAASLSYRR